MVGSPLSVVFLRRLSNPRLYLHPFLCELYHILRKNDNNCCDLFVMCVVCRWMTKNTSYTEGYYGIFQIHFKYSNEFEIIL